jgi:hypothetical protein
MHNGGTKILLIELDLMSSARRACQQEGSGLAVPLLNSAFSHSLTAPLTSASSWGGGRCCGRTSSCGNSLRAFHVGGLSRHVKWHLTAVSFITSLCICIEFYDFVYVWVHFVYIYTYINVHVL